MMNASPSIASRMTPLLLAALIILAPLFRSGKIPLATLLLELLAVAAFLALWWSGERRRVLGGLEVFCWLRWRFSHCCSCCHCLGSVR